MIFQGKTSYTLPRTNELSDFDFSILVDVLYLFDMIFALFAFGLFAAKRIFAHEARYLWPCALFLYLFFSRTLSSRDEAHNLL